MCVSLDSVKERLICSGEKTTGENEHRDFLNKRVRKITVISCISIVTLYF